MKQFAAIIFDFDGVIIDSQYLHYAAYRSVFEHIGLSLSFEAYLIEEYTGMSDKEMFHQLLINKGYQFAVEDINAFFNLKVERYAQLVHHAEDLPIIEAAEQYILQMAKAGKKLAICTGSTRQEIIWVLSKEKYKHILPCFQVLISADDVRRAKPSSEGYLLAAERLNVEPKQCLAIEDSPSGIEAAKNAGMYTTAILTTHRRDQLLAADEIITHFSELLV